MVPRRTQLVEGATNRWLLLTNAQLADAGSYTLVATNGAGQTNGLSASLAVQPDPAVAEVLTPRNVLVGQPFACRQTFPAPNR